MILNYNSVARFMTLFCSGIMVVIESFLQTFEFLKSCKNYFEQHLHLFENFDTSQSDKYFFFQSFKNMKTIKNHKQKSSISSL